MSFRNARISDTDALIDIGLKTGLSGDDATGLYTDIRLIGLIYSVPYVHYHAEQCFVAEDEQGILGYVVGVFDTRTFEAWCAENWWPQWRAELPDPGADFSPRFTPDQVRQFQIHHTEQIPEVVCNAFPAHMHLNLHPRAQGQGLGPRLCHRWLDTARENGVKRVHVGVSAKNARGKKFWKKCGFADIDHPALKGEVWLGQNL